MDQQSGPSATKEQKDRSLAELMGDLSRGISELISAEIAVAKAKIAEKLSLVGIGAALIFGALMALIMVVLCATALVIIALDNLVALWLAALIVTGLWLLAAVALALIGMQMIKRASPDTEKPAADTLKEDMGWEAKPTS